MGHDKLRKFAENETFKCLLQPSASDILGEGGYFALTDHPIKGHWNTDMFSSLQQASPENRLASLRPHPSGPPSYVAEGGTGFLGEPAATATPLVVELGCGKGEYTLELARRNADKNFIGVDIKGARLWRGAKTATEEGLTNAAFLRTRIEFLTALFAPGEVSEIWLTFSDPQMKSENSRLSSPLFLERYRNILKQGGIVHLKTDSRFLHEYTKAVVEANGLRMLCCTNDLYGEGAADESIAPIVREVHTFYENMFLEQGYKITYLSFCIDKEGEYVHPTEEQFDEKYWREAEGPRRSFGHAPSKKQ